MGARELSKRKRCVSCRCLFRPSPRVGQRQRFCSKPECQRERHRRSCKRWHAKNPDYNKRARLQAKVAPEEMAQKAVPLCGDPLSHLDLEAVRPDVKLAVVVVLEEAFRAHREWMLAGFVPSRPGLRNGGSVRGSP